MTSGFKRRIRCLTVISISLVAAAASQATTLDQYLDALREHHPVFKSEQLSIQIEEVRQEGLLGQEDWILTATPSYEYDEPVEPYYGSPYETQNTLVDVGLGRSFWSSGGQLELGYTYDNQQNKTDYSPGIPGSGEFYNFAGPSEFFRNAASLSYRQPLLKNRGGIIDSLPYDLQGYTIEEVTLWSMEKEEDLLLRMGSLFLDWVLYTEEIRIGQRRLDIAVKDQDRNQERYDENLIEKVDLLRAEDAVYTTEQALKRVESFQAAVRAELEWQASGGIKIDKPVYDLKTEVEQITDADITSDVIASLRRMKVLDVRIAQLERELAGLLNNKQSELDLIVFGNLKDGSEEYSDSVGFDNPGAGVALSFSYPLNNRSARAGYQRAALESSRAVYDKEAVRLDLEAAAHSLIAEMKDLRKVLEINQRQIEAAANKTKEEQRLYNQGRNPFNFVLQSQDDEARAQLEFARNSVTLRKLALRLDAVLDRIVKSPAD